MSVTTSLTLYYFFEMSKKALKLLLFSFLRPREAAELNHLALRAGGSQALKYQGVWMDEKSLSCLEGK